MIIVTCNEVTVKFKSFNSGQRIRFSDSVSTAHFLQVTEDGTRLVVKYKSKEGRTVKILAFPLTDVREYTCEEIMRDHSPE